MEKVFVFIDEYGNTTLKLDKESTPSHFIYSGIVIKEIDLDKARSTLLKLQKKFNQGSPLKSSNLFRKGDSNQKLNKRIQILNTLKNNLNFLVFSLVIDKKQLFGTGLSYKKSFIKYFQKLFNENIKDNYSQYSIYMDKLGDEYFRNSLTQYISKELDLFGNNTYQLADDKFEEPLLQLADIIANSIGRCYCINQIDENADKIIECLKDYICIEQFPMEKTLYFGNIQYESTDDQKISEIAVNKAINYIEGNETQIEHIEVLKYLLLMFRTNPFRTISTKELVNTVKRKNINFSQSQLRTVIQDLRDKGVIIASLQGKWGYKIPNTKNDMIEFFNRYLNSVIPMLKRVRIANDQLQIKSVNELNLLSSDGDFIILKKLIDQI